MCRPSPVQTTGSLASECGPFVHSVNLETPQARSIPKPTQDTTTGNTVETTDRRSTTTGITPNRATLPQVPTTENDSTTPRHTRVNSGETARVQPGERPAETVIHTNTIDLKLRSFNAKGFKQSSEYILDMLRHTYILCISESWIRPHEINLIHNWTRPPAWVSTRTQ